MGSMRCPRCSQDNPVSAKFCLECGLRLAGGVSLRETSPEAHTPAHLAEKILTTRQALEGERKQVTVLFADLKGSMELLADRDPEEARKILDPVLERMMDAVHRYEGTVNQVMGDGIMALFGAPLAHEDHAVRACYAALRMQETISAYGDEMQRAHGVPIQIRVGLNSGEVVVRAIGGDLRMDYTAVGPSTHLAARMEQIARPGTTLATADTMRLAEGHIEFKARGLMTVKGLDAPLDVYEVVKVGPLRSRLQVAAARGLTRFVGRERELVVMRAALSDARKGHGRVVGLVGEAGVGKSRLVWEFLRSGECQDCLVMESRAVSYRQATAYASVIDLLRGYFQIESRDDGRKIREKITGKLLTLDRALERELPALLAVLGIPFDDPEWQQLEPSQRRQRIIEGTGRLLMRESRMQPIIIVMEDLHWLDSETKALLETAVRNADTRRLLILNYRPEFQHGWATSPTFTELTLEPLAAESAGALLEELLGRDPSLDTLTPLLVERTEGNPFFLEESVRALVETQALAGNRGSYRLVTALPAVQVPPTVQAILAARIDRLLPQEKRLLQAASVVGKEVPLALLKTIADLPEDALRQALDHLQAGDFIHESQLFPDVEYSFKHALTHDVAYGSLLHDRRRALHAQIADVMEWSCGDRLCEQIDRIAYHAIHGEQWEKALDYSRQAAARAAERSAHQEAAASLEQALVVLQHLADHRDTHAEAIDVRIELRHSLLNIGQHRRLLTVLAEARTLAEALGDERRQGAVAAFSINGHYLVGQHHQAIEAAHRALTLATKLDDAALRGTANYYLAQVHQGLGDYWAATQYLRWNVDTFGDRAPLDRGRLGRLVILSHSWLSWCLTVLGDTAAGLKVAERATALAEASGSAEIMASVRSGNGRVYLLRHEVPQAIEELQRALVLCEEIDTPLLEHFTVGHLGQAYVLAGRLDDGIHLMETSSRLAESLGIVAAHANRLVWLGDGYRRAGRLDEAQALAARGLDLAREREERGHEALALVVRAAIAIDREPTDTAAAEADCRAALEIAESCAMLPLAARCLLGLGMTYRRAGKLDQARHHLMTSQERFRAMSLPAWVERVDAELTALS